MVSAYNLNRILKKLTRVGSVFPLIWFLGVLALYIRARAYLGYWPIYNNPDPESLPFLFHHVVFALAVFPVFWSIFVLPVFWIFQIVMQRRIAPRMEMLEATLSRRLYGLIVAAQNVQKEVGLYLLGWALIWTTFYLPHRGFVDWFLD